MIYLTNDPYPQEISIPRSFGVIVPRRTEYLTGDDIATDLETDSDRKVLAASQGVRLKEMVDEKADAGSVYTKTETDELLDDKADKDDTYTKQETDDLLAEKANLTDIPDVSQFITRSVNDLANYYLKSETYTQQEVRDLIAAINQFHYEVYASLSDVTDPQSNVLYLIGPTGTGGDKYEEYVFTTEWVKIGDTSIDLSGYVTTQALNTALADYVTNSALATALAGKQDTLESGMNIKTINNESILGGGNISIQAEPEIFWATYGVTTSQEIDQAVADGKSVMLKISASEFGFLTKSTATHHFFFHYENGKRLLLYVLTKSSGNWTITENFEAENTNNKSQSVPTDRTSTTKYPSVKAVFDSLGKWGVVSQTQTWTGSAAAGWTYTMSNLVWGLIPQSSIDLYESAGAVFNATTGYFEMNGITDLSYDEIRLAYKFSYQNNGQWVNIWQTELENVRTNFPLTEGSSTTSQITTKHTFNSLVLYYWTTMPNMEYFRLARQEDRMIVISPQSGYLFYTGTSKLKKVIGILNVYGTSTTGGLFFASTQLESIKLYELRTSWDIRVAKNLDLDSIVFVVTYAINASAITITLHATAYARCQADTTEYTLNGNTYTGILAYASARNITIASA